MSPYFENTLDKLKDFMFEKVYNNKEVRKQDKEIKKILKFLFKYFYSNFHLLPETIKIYRTNEELYIKVIDYLAGMTDNFAIKQYNILVDKKNILCYNLNKYCDNISSEDKNY